jgi:cytoskeletal protein RodZ
VRLNQLPVLSSGRLYFSAMTTTVGQELRQAREARSLSIDQASVATRIRPHYLQALESGDFGALPSVAQARGFLRAYAEYLGLNPDPLLVALEGKEPAPAAPAQEAAPGNGTDVELPQEAATIFAEVGSRLQRQRELLGLSLEDVERHTHLRRHYLVALESGDLDGLPSPVQGRGMLNNYAAFLGLNPDPLLLRFAEGLQLRLAARQASQPKARPAPKRRSSSLPAPLRRILSGDVLIGGGLAVFLVVFVFWGAIRIFATLNQPQVTPTAPSIVEVLLATPTPTATDTPIPVTPTAPLPQQLFPTQALATDPVTGALLSPQPISGVQVYINVRQRAWMRVLVDGQIEFEGRVVPGSAYSFAGETSVEIQTGNGAALQVLYNGVDLGTLGAFGQVVDRIFSLQGEVTATPTITPTAGPTQPFTPTLPATVTPPAQVTAPALP